MVLARGEGFHPLEGLSFTSFHFFSLGSQLRFLFTSLPFDVIRLFSYLCFICFIFNCLFNFVETKSETLHFLHAKFFAFLRRPSSWRRRMPRCDLSADCRRPRGAWGAPCIPCTVEHRRVSSWKAWAKRSVQFENLIVFYQNAERRFSPPALCCIFLCKF